MTDTNYIAGLVSVVIPSYNRGKYLRQTIESVLNQTHRNVELFVVDDGSTDDSLAITRSYGEKLTLLQHPNGENRGQSASINLGIAAARGEFIAVLDSDDYWMLDKLEKQVLFLNEDADVGVVYGNALMVDENGNKLYQRYADDHVESGGPEALLLDCYLSIPGNSLVRHQIYDEVGEFDESLRAAQDHDMAIRLAEATRFGYIGDLMFSYRRHAESISAGSTLKRWRNGFKILAKAQKRYPYPTHVIRKRRAVLHFRMAQCLLGEHRALRALPHVAGSFVNDPLRSIAVILGRERISSPNS